ncbi:MAG: BTB/POZ domain-containing protein, partial [Sulfitobacter sp.]|nr:BTB/POZ domain-containing protein [Sulfitobacter sp.]
MKHKKTKAVEQQKTEAVEQQETEAVEQQETEAVDQQETEAAEQQKFRLTFNDPNLSSMILSGLNQQREDDVLTDIIICTANSRISAHKAVLSAFS